MTQKLTRQTAFRLDREDESLLQAISDKLKLRRSDIVRMAIRRMAESENVTKVPKRKAS